MRILSLATLVSAIALSTTILSAAEPEGSGITLAPILPPEAPWSGKSESLVAADGDPWITPAEATGFDRTANYAETVDWQAKLRDREAREKSAARSRVVEKGALSHQPLRDGTCTACHQPHASDTADLMREESPIAACGACHDWLKHSSHPMGGKHVDQRNRNLSVDCLSCHRSHGSGNRYLMAFPTNTELCVQCHKQLRR